MSSGPLVLHRPSEGAGNTCAGGKLLPEFYVLGAKNTATSSLAHDLMRRGVMPAPQGVGKEWEFFQANSKVSDEGLLFNLWFDALPQCPGGGRAVMADFSVVNLYSVPMPPDLSHSQEYGYPSRPNINEQNFNTPKYVKDFYSNLGAKQPKLMVMLREPLARLQSEYYHTLPLQNCVGCKANSSFVDSFAFNVQLLQRSPPEVSDWFWKSYYARHIEAWLEQHDASRFIMVPYKEYVSIDPPAFSEQLLQWMDFGAAPWKEASHKNEHTIKPLLAEELLAGAASRTAFEAVMAPEEDRLVGVLARAHRGGAVLPGYSGPEGDGVQIRAWLERGW